MAFIDTFIQLCNQREKAPTSVCQELGLSDAIFSYWRKKRCLPRPATLQKIADYFSVSVNALTSNVTTDDILSTKRIIKVPVYGNVVAGLPIEAITDIEDVEEFDATNYPDAEFFALRIVGDSMLPKISPGDIVIVKWQEAVYDGDVVIAMIDDFSATCKKYKCDENGITLISWNEKYPPLFFNREDARNHLKFLGKVVELRAKL